MKHARSPNLPSTTTPTKKRQILSTTPSNQHIIHSDTTEAKSTQDDPLSSPRAAVSSTSTNTNTNTKTSADHLIHQSKENKQHRLLQTTPQIQQPTMTHSAMTPPTPSSLSKTSLLTTALSSFRRQQSRQAEQHHHEGVPAPPCPVCFENMTRGINDTHRLRLFICGHAACASCWKTISSSARVACPLCRCSLKTAAPVNTHNVIPTTERDGTFIVSIMEYDGQSFSVSCCWTTKFGEILDVIAPLRAHEFESIVFPRANLLIGLKVNGTFLQFPAEKTLADVGYDCTYEIVLNESPLRAPHPIVTARLKRFARGRTMPSGTFTVELRCVADLRPTFTLEVVKSTTLVEVACRLREKIRCSGVAHAKWFARKEKKFVLYGGAVRAVWDQMHTTLEGLCCQEVLYYR